MPQSRVPTALPRSRRLPAGSGVSSLAKKAAAFIRISRSPLEPSLLDEGGAILLALRWQAPAISCVDLALVDPLLAERLGRDAKVTGYLRDLPTFVRGVNQPDGFSSRVCLISNAHVLGDTSLPPPTGSRVLARRWS